MRRLLLLPSFFVLGACAESRLKPGGYKSGLAVVSEGRFPGEGKLARAAALAQAERRAVEGLLPLYAPSEVLSSSAHLSERILNRASDFVKRRKAVKARSEGGATTLTARVLVDASRLSKELDALGLIRPDGVAGKPVVSVSLEEPGTLVSEALSRVLAARGYAIAPRGARAELVLSGRAESAPAADPRLTGLHARRARVFLRVAHASGEVLGPVEQEATAVDLAAQPAQAKALASAGELAADAAARLLSAQYKERRELLLVVHGFARLERAFSLVSALRALKPVAAAAFDSMYGGQLRLRVWAERLSADELAALLLREKGLGLSVRVVEPDYATVEMDFGRSGAD